MRPPPHLRLQSETILTKEGQGDHALLREKTREPALQAQ